MIDEEEKLIKKTFLHRDINYIRFEMKKSSLSQNKFFYPHHNNNKIHTLISPFILKK